MSEVLRAGTSRPPVPGEAGAEADQEAHAAGQVRPPLLRGGAEQAALLPQLDNGAGAPASVATTSDDGFAAPETETRGESQPLPEELRPAEVVRRLDEFIVGQAPAKRAVAVALRNRLRRMRLSDEMREEVIPKNILMIGPTGVGKTEIARRLARLTHSPFLKVEATKFTEVGYVGRDVEAIIRDLLEQTITEVHNGRIAEVEEKAREVAEERILDALVEGDQRRGKPAMSAAALATVDHDSAPPADGAAGAAATPASADEEPRRRNRLRRRLARRLRDQQLEDRYVEIEVEEPFQPAIEGFSGAGFEEIGTSLSDFFSQLAPPRRKLKRLCVADARTVLIEEETDRLIDMDRVYDDSIRLVEESGIVFIDEVDKIAGVGSEHGPDVSGQGVQRDLLPILEGSTVHTRYGSVRTDHVLFVAAGAFTMARPSDLIPEFQGRFPIRVELSPLSENDLERILVEPSNALTRQYAALLATEDVTLEFPAEGVHELAHQAALVNEQDENIGARRLFTILEKVLEEVSFRAEDFAGQTVVVDRELVRARLTDLVRNEDLRRYVL
ncbi:MAG TPA: ATP-dependent protease ATPase subunit HslU [Candidatus Dormibacteraeota bacterium]|nr:ATP-dependent protease ATPase subunit HslU [Candidatus Dormibacteraeota bacterium]